MSRYIDADNAIEVWKDQDYIKLSSQETKARIMLDAVPSADVVEVVHCKDCIYALGKVNKNNVICNKQDWATTWREDDYCSDGERKEGETT